jgi:two-component system NtrC family sensor kinase
MLDEILLMLSNQGGVQAVAGGRVRIVREEGVPAVKAAVDPSQMRQALWNLCLNAVEAMPRGGELRVNVRSVETDSGAFLEITVRDTGVGIEADHLAHVFEPFYTTKPHGTGLGLAIAHRIVKDHGGEIRVESERGSGSLFTILVPVGEA